MGSLLQLDLVEYILVVFLVKNNVDLWQKPFILLHNNKNNPPPTAQQETRG